MNITCPNCKHCFELKKEHKPYVSAARNPFDKAQKILVFLKKQEDWVWLRKIAKETSITPYAVSYIIERYLNPYLEVLDTQTVYASSGLKLKMFKLKNLEIDPKVIINDLKLRSNSS